MKWKIGLLILALACVLALPLTAGAETVHEGTWGTLTWTLDNQGTLTISGNGAMNALYNSTDAWRAYSSDIQSVAIEPGVTSIGKYAFRFCSSLTSVTIPDSVTSIGEVAFGSCTSLSEIHISSLSSWLNISYDDSYSSHPNYNHSWTLYIDGVEITSVTIPDGVTSIGGMAFYKCTSLTSITISDGVTSIGMSAFSNCTSLASITIPDGVTSIGAAAFYGCSGLTSITIPDGVTSIGYQAFRNCTSLTSITIPDSVTSIGDGVFQDCTSLTSITIPDGVTSIGERTFYDCTSLTSITIPDSVTSIGDNAFYGCQRLTSITIPDGVTSIGNKAFYNCCNLTSVTIPDSVTQFGSNLFYNAYPKFYCGLNSPASLYVSKQERNFRLPGTSYDLRYLFEYNFQTNLERCTGLVLRAVDQDAESVAIPEGVTSIGTLFSGHSMLTSVTLPTSITRISDNAFKNCTSLTSITIPDSITSIGSNAFSGCSSLSQIHISSILSWLSIGYADNTYDSHPNRNSNCHLFMNGSELTSITIPDGVTGIGDYAFSGFSGLTSITIPNSVTSIGNYAFYKCTRLTSITIPNSVTSIGSYVFRYCTGLTSITIPDSVISIDDYAFSDCTGLTSITIPDSMTVIQNNVFSNCTGLTSITIPDSVTSIGNSALSGCSSLTSITIPNSVTSIDNYAFFSCIGLTSVTIPDSVTQINNYVFRNCSSLTSVTIPDSVTYIGYGAFYDCTGLTSVTIPDCVTYIGENAFYDCANLTSVTIPDGITFIADRTFAECTSLTSITLPNSVTNIYYQAFLYCTSLTNITLPDSVTYIGDRAFSYCNKLTSLDLNNVTSIHKNAFDNCSAIRYASLGSAGAITLSKNGYSFRVPNTNYDVIYMFSNDAITGLRLRNADKDAISVSILEGVTQIDGIAFKNCTSLRNVTIPDSVTSIGSNAFSSCSSLPSITIPDSVTSIGYRAFEYCYALTKVAFTLQDESASISFDQIFGGRNPVVYCYMFSAIDGWATRNGFTVVYLDDIDMDSIRTIILPANFRLALGESRQITAGLFPDIPEDNEPITWSSSNPSVVSVNDGLVTALDAGAATITATVGSKSANVRVEVFIPASGFDLNVTEAWVLAKSPLQLSVTSFTPINAVAEITWKSSDTTKASVDGNGLVTTILPGDVIITATTERGVARECLVHLCYPVTGIELIAPQDKLLTDRDLQLIANVTMRSQTCVNHLVTFTSSDESVATVNADTGAVHGVAPGTVTLTATAASNVSASVEIQVLDKNALSRPSFPGQLTSIEAEAFAGTAFQAFIIPETVTAVGSQAFAYCPNLIYVYIPASVTDLAEDAFAGCENVIIERGE